jgi:hypothetical protein
MAPDTGCVTSDTDVGNVFGWNFAVFKFISFLVLGFKGWRPRALDYPRSPCHGLLRVEEDHKVPLVVQDMELVTIDPVAGR